MSLHLFLSTKDKKEVMTRRVFLLGFAPICGAPPHGDQKWSRQVNCPCTKVLPWGENTCTCHPAQLTCARDSDKLHLFYQHKTSKKVCSCRGLKAHGSYCFWRFGTSKIFERCSAFLAPEVNTELRHKRNTRILSKAPELSGILWQSAGNILGSSGCFPLIF